MLFGFFFATVSSRITGLIGSSSNPISGMTIATLIITCVIFVALGWTGDVYGPVALSVGAIVCIAAANAGNTSQDLKTGYIVGATPIYQQIGLAIGVVTSSFVIGMTVLYMHRVFGIGSADVAAPQATLMATLIKGLLSQNLPWGLVLVGVFISVTLELCGVHSLSFAVGAYLPIATTAPIFAGGMVRWWVEREDRGDQRLGSQLGYALQLGPDRRRIAGRHSLRGALRRRHARPVPVDRERTALPARRGHGRSAGRLAAVRGPGRHPVALRAEEDRIGRGQNRSMPRVPPAVPVVWMLAAAVVATQPAVEVIFHLPRQDEAGVSLRAPVRLQFSADLDPSTLAGNITLQYSVEDSRDRGEPEPPVIRFTATYDGKDRSVTVRPATPWERFREVRLRLSDGIRGTSGAPLTPFALAFTTGGS